MAELLSQQEAVNVLQSQRREVLALIGPLTAEQACRPGLGGGEWSVKDLLGHLESWEEHVLKALEAWSKGERALVDVATYGEGINALNAREVARKAERTFGEQQRLSEETHRRLAETIASLSAGRLASARHQKGPEAAGLARRRHPCRKARPLPS